MPPRNEQRERGPRTINNDRLADFKERLFREYPKTGEKGSFLPDEAAQFVSFFDDKSANPEFIPGAKPVGLTESNDFFKALLAEQGALPSEVQNIFQKHIQPINTQIVEQTKIIEHIEKSIETKKSESPFAALGALNTASAEESADIPTEDLIKQRETERSKLKRMIQSRMLLMRDVLLNPGNYTLNPELYGTPVKDIVLPAKTFLERVQSGATSDLFSVNGNELPLKAKESLAHEVIASLFDTSSLSEVQKKQIESALQLLERSCVQSLFDEMSAIPSLAAPESFRNKLMKQKVGALQQFLAQIGKDPLGMVGKYGAYIWEGTHNPELVYFPKLSLRLPEGVKAKIAAAKNPTEKRRLEKEGWDKVVSTYSEEQQKHIVDGYSLKDKAGFKPEGLIAAELTKTLLSLGYDEASMEAVGNSVVKPCFEKRKEVGQKLRELSGSQANATEIRAQKRLRQKSEQEFLEQINMYLSDPEYFQLDASLLMIEHKEPEDLILANASMYEIVASLPSGVARAAYVTDLCDTYKNDIRKSLELVYGTGFDLVLKDNRDIEAEYDALVEAEKILKNLLATDTLDKQAIDLQFETIERVVDRLTQSVTE